MELTSREAARKNFEPRYFTGKPCKYGHVADRYVISGGCSACLREYSNRYRCKTAALAGVKYVTLPYRLESDVDTLRQVAFMLLDQSSPTPVDIGAERTLITSRLQTLVAPESMPR